MAENYGENNTGFTPGRVLRITLTAVLLILFITALLSYSPTDAAIIIRGTSGEPENWIGMAGAVVAHTLLLHIGLASYLLLLLVVIRAVRTGLNELNPRLQSRKFLQSISADCLILAGALLLFGLAPEVFSDALTSLGLGHGESGRSGLSGGVIGQYFSAPRCGDLPEGILRRFIGTVGTAVVGMGLIFGGLIWLYIADWKELVKSCFDDGLPKDEPQQPPQNPRGVQMAPPVFVQPPLPEQPRPEPSAWTSSRVPEKPVTPAAPVIHAEPAAPAMPEEPEIPEEPEELEEINFAASRKASDPLPPQDDTITAPLYDTPPPAPVPAAAPSLRSSDITASISRQGVDQSAPVSSDYVLPPVTMLSQGDESDGEDPEEISAAKDALTQTLEDFGIRGWVSNYTSGPRVTRFEVTLERGVSVRKVEQIADNIAMNLAAQSVRILAPIPGRSVVGVEISNSKSSAVFMRSVMESDEWKKGKAEIPIALGKDVSGKPVVLDIASAPHMLVAGSTGTGKSVCSNSLIMSLLFRFRPDELKLIMVDPKVVEFAVYKNLPHLITPVINDSNKVPVALRWAVNEMEKRYRILAKARVKKISEFNSRPNIEEELFDDDGIAIPKRLPVLIIIIDELGDLMMTESKKDVESSITRIAQKGRAAGVHVIVATQRPSTNVITGVIKANLPTRLCFQVRSLIDSRVVLDIPGGEKLLGKGDMLYMSPSSMHIERVQGSFVPDSDIMKIVDFVSSQAPQQFNSDVISEEEVPGEEDDDDDDPPPWGEDGGAGEISKLAAQYMKADDPPVMLQALEIVISERKASTSYLQRRLGIGYNKAAELIDQMEKRGIVGPPSGSGNKRDILIFDGMDIRE